MAKLTEKRLLRVSPQLFTADGTNLGEIKVPDTSLFVVGHIVKIGSNTQPTQILKVKRITNKLTMFLGPEKEPIHARSDVSAYLLADGAFIEAQEQNRPTIPEQEIERNTYDEEPIVARRTRLVDRYGNDASSSESSVSTDEPTSKFFYGNALEVIRIVEYAPNAIVGDPLKETFFTYGPSLEVVKIETVIRAAQLGDLA